MSANLEQRLQQYGPVLVRAFLHQGLPAVWGVAIACQESSLRPDQVNNKGGDAALGGAYGLCQVTLHTARRYVADITPEELLVPGTNAAIAARICADNNKRVPGSFVDVLALYNDGKLYSSPHLSSHTRDEYIPRVLHFADVYRGFAARISLQIAEEPSSS